jgi:hypothetical protein
MTDLPVGARHLVMKVPETELGDCPESESNDEEEDPSKRFYTTPLLGDDLRTTRADVSKNGKPRDGSDDSAD